MLSMAESDCFGCERAAGGVAQSARGRVRATDHPYRAAPCRRWCYLRPARTGQVRARARARPQSEGRAGREPAARLLCSCPPALVLVPLALWLHCLLHLPLGSARLGLAWLGLGATVNIQQRQQQLSTSFGHKLSPNTNSSLVPLVLLVSTWLTQYSTHEDN